MSLAVEGAELRNGAALPLLDELRSAASQGSPDRAGKRIDATSRLASFLAPESVLGEIAKGFLGREARPVRGILFDKSPAANWALGWHQDRTICVREKIEVDGFGPWSLKGGWPHVEPPFAVLARMLTMRVHLDDVARSNAPLLVAPGSHRLGRVLACDIATTVARCGGRACLATAGDVWMYATPILHASEAATNPSQRRVLQVDFAAEALPGGLRWRALGSSAPP